MNTVNYEQKYLKYKLKYLQLKNQLYGGFTLEELRQQLMETNADIAIRQKAIEIELDKRKQKILIKELEKPLSKKGRIESDIKKEEDKLKAIKIQKDKDEAERIRLQNLVKVKVVDPIVVKPNSMFAYQSRTRSDSVSSTDSNSSTDSSSSNSSNSSNSTNDSNEMRQREKEALEEIDRRSKQDNFKIKIILSNRKSKLQTTFDNVPIAFAKEMVDLLKLNRGVGGFTDNINGYATFVIRGDAVNDGKNFLINKKKISEDIIIIQDMSKVAMRRDDGFRKGPSDPSKELNDQMRS